MDTTTKPTTIIVTTFTRNSDRHHDTRILKEQEHERDQEHEGGNIVGCLRVQHYASYKSDLGKSAVCTE